MVPAGLETAASDGESIDDYRLVRPLGHDGATFLAHDRLLDRAVVLSLLPGSHDARAERLAVARVFARVSHPNLGRVHRVREGGARPYVIAAFSRGQRLARIASPLQDARVLDLARCLAGALAALHSAGVTHGEVCADRVIVSDEGAPQLVGFARARTDAGAAAKRADVAALLDLVAALAGGDLRRRLASLTDFDHGVASAEELCRAVESLAHPALTRDALSENPYRGLRAFETQHAAAFFGREHEVIELVERLRDQPWLLIAGRSGTGKSSLARAGVAPAVARGALGERAWWDVVTMVPGAHPIAALERAMGPFAATRTDRGLLLVVDQLEEVFTLAGRDERGAFCGALERFGTLSPGVRVLFTLRGDFLDQLAELGPFGRHLLRAAYVLRAMSQDGLRAAIEAPASARGIEFETPAMVEALVDEVKRNDEALPLLSFALAELWSARDSERGIIPDAAFRDLGGAVAALVRHGDLVLATLRAEERGEARRILVALVTDGAGRTADDLVGTRGAPARAALEALVRGRLVVAGESYGLAHEALARAWPRLREWRDEASEARAVAARLVVAAQEWVRLGRGPEGLGSERLLRDLAIPGALEGASEEALAFVEASRAAARRSRLRRWALVAAAPIFVCAAGATAWTLSYTRHRAAVAQALADARTLNAKADEAARSADAVRAEAILRFEKDDLGPAEALWQRMLALEEDVDRQRRDVGVAIDEALTLDPRDHDARAHYADVTLARLLAAERLHKGALLRELRARLDAYDDGSRAARLTAPGHVRVETDPPGATLRLARYREDASGRLVEADTTPFAVGPMHALEPGSYLIVAEAPGRYTTRYPFLARRGEELPLRIVLPRATDVPEGMVYVPAGRSLYGSSDDEATRGFLTHQPMHDVDVGPFLIARNEVTNGDYLVFLRALPDAERKARLPSGLALSSDGSIVWKLRERTLAPGEPYCSGVQPCVDWSRLPVEAASREDGERLAAWLSQTGRLPGARLCTDCEWERAARGADDRRYPNGNGDLGPGDACTLATYGGDALRAGPCAPGTHAASRSPFGVDDMVGNEWEWTAGPADVALPTQAVARGASWAAFGMYLSISNRGLASVTRGYASQGLRLCADANVPE